MGQKIVIVGAGLAGLKAAVTCARAGVEVSLVCRLNGGRAASGCAQGGINAALNHYNDGDSPLVHFRETVRAGAFLANQKKCLELCESAPQIVGELAEKGVLFNRMADGRLEQRFFGGSLHRRTCFVGSSTGQALLAHMESACLYYEAKGLVTRYEGYEFLSIVKDGSGDCIGITAQRVVDGEIIALEGTVIMASGGSANIYGRSTNPRLSNGSALGALFEQGVKLANPEFIQFHPTAMLGSDKNRLISEAARSEGGRVFTYRDGERWYFLEEMFPRMGNLITRDEASKAIYHVCNELGLGADEKYDVLLDISHLSDKKDRLGSIIELYQKYAKADPNTEPMHVFPSAHYNMGGLYVDEEYMTNVRGLYAAGECEYSCHGANRLGANSLLSAIHSGQRAADSVLRSLSTNNGNKKDALLDEIRIQRGKDTQIRSMCGREKAYSLRTRLGNVMRENVYIVRYNEILEATGTVLDGMLDRWNDLGIGTAEASNIVSQNVSVLDIRQLHGMLSLARAMTKAALMRDESRGAHYKPFFPDRNDKDFLKTTIVSMHEGEISVTYEDVDTSIYPVEANTEN